MQMISFAQNHPRIGVCRRNTVAWSATHVYSMGTEEPTGGRTAKAANGLNGQSTNGSMDRSNSCQHFDGKGKDVIPLYRCEISSI